MSNVRAPSGAHACLHGCRRPPASGRRINRCSASRPASENVGALGRAEPNAESSVSMASSRYSNQRVPQASGEHPQGRPNHRVLQGLRTRGRTRQFQSVEGASRRRAAPGSRPVAKSGAPSRAAVSPPNSVAYAGTRQNTERVSPCPSSSSALTLPSRGRPQAGFAHLRPPLMSNVSRHRKECP